MVQFKWVKCMACEFYLTMATKKKKKKKLFARDHAVMLHGSRGERHH